MDWRSGAESPVQAVGPPHIIMLRNPSTAPEQIKRAVGRGHVQLLAFRAGWGALLFSGIMVVRYQFSRSANCTRRGLRAADGRRNSGSTCSPCRLNRAAVVRLENWVWL